MSNSNSGAGLLKALGQLIVTIALMVYSLIVIIRQRDKAHSECESEYRLYAVVASTFIANILAMFFVPLFVVSFPSNTTPKAFLQNLLPCSSPSSSSLFPTNPLLASLLNWAFLLCNFLYFVLMPALAFWGIAVLAQLSGEDCKTFYQDAEGACDSRPGGAATSFCVMFVERLGRLYGQMIFQAIVALLPLTIGLLVSVGLLLSASPCCKTSKKKEDTKEALEMNKDETASLLNNPV
ncbi:hypothetical protein QOT17_021447 [Balamuthia mandrillaris]